jgi:hypothetical protein
VSDLNQRAGTGFSIFLRHAPYFFTLILLVQLPLLLLALLGTVLGGAGALLNLMAFSGFLMATPLWNGALMISLGRITDRGEIEIPEAYRESAMAYPRLLPVYMLCMLAVLAGSFFFILPGVFLGLRFCLAPFASLFEKLDGVAALRRSWDLTGGRLLELLLYFLVPVLPGLMLQAIRLNLLPMELTPASIALFNFIAQLVSIITGTLMLSLLHQVYQDAARPAPPRPGTGEVLFTPPRLPVERREDDDAKG